MKVIHDFIDIVYKYEHLLSNKIEKCDSVEQVCKQVISFAKDFLFLEVRAIEDKAEDEDEYVYDLTIEVKGIGTNWELLGRYSFGCEDDDFRCCSSHSGIKSMVRDLIIHEINHFKGW